MSEIFKFSRLTNRLQLAKSHALTNHHSAVIKYF